MTSAVLRPEMEDRGRYRRESTTNRALECSTYPFSNLAVRLFAKIKK
jgi:hypothetical protein